MSSDYFFAENAPPPGGSYSHGVVANGLLFTCGMGPVDPSAGKIVAGGVAEQTRQTLMNLQAVLAERGATLDQVIKVTAHLQDVLADFAAYDGVYREFFKAPFPVRTTVGSQLANILVEIDLVVAL
jgi:2-iminobutanoate/2-iminopropanoate deaminase